MRASRTRLGLLAVLLVTGCGSGGGTDRLADSGTEPTRNDLTVEFRPSTDAETQRFTLVCAAVADGDHPDAEAACRHLQSLDEPFAPIPADAVCTEQYGGPQTARVSGRWDGEPVDLALSRTDGCHISQWDRLGPLLPPTDPESPSPPDSPVY